MKLWLPRGLSIAYIVFISLFALDVFGAGHGWMNTLVALITHLMPTYTLIALLVTAWINPKAGGAGFILFFMFTILFFKSCERIDLFLLIGLPPLLVGMMFLMMDDKN
ncbi:MAG TPA: hypothetical protein VMD02_06350 [Candidatus Omnitrophota bacterium]|nr:hypothetical protein [Candidatus Omnitrophota bacterium]